jgi:transcriptional regulator with PAS, ATPase and Fis domain
VKYSWPGNVHELQYVIRKIVSVCVEEQEITPADLPDFAALRAEMYPCEMSYVEGMADVAKLAALRAQW